MDMRTMGYLLIGAGVFGALGGVAVVMTEKDCMLVTEYRTAKSEKREPSDAAKWAYSRYVTHMTCRVIVVAGVVLWIAGTLLGR